jgi:23S rRNA pseudouridine1911/1915/1917 synthase
MSAALHYLVLAKSEKYVLLEIDLITGRHHQIRAQLSAMGSPIKGDVKYGSKRGNKDRSIHLHAWKLSFVHPISHEEVCIEAPLPSDALWDYFRPFCEKPMLPPTQSKE